MGDSQSPALAHVLIFPLPLQGPVNCMLKLAELFCLAGIHVTFLNTHHIQQRLVTYSDVQSTFKRYPNFQFMTIPDGLPEDNPRTRDQIIELFESMDVVSAPLLRDILLKSDEKPVTCVIADGFFSFAVDVAREVSVPLVYFDTISPCGLWTYFCLPKLIQSGEYPFQGDDLDVPINCVLEMDCIIRRRDLPSFYRDTKPEDRLIQLVLKEGQKLKLAQAIIFNTFEDLERSTLNHMRSLGPKVYAIGPVHLYLKTKLGLPELEQAAASSSNSLWEEDNSSIAWLNKQPPKSVVYVSIGSLAVMTKEDQLEIWHGLVNSGVRFLWVQRQGSIRGESVEIEAEEELLVEKTKEMGYVVKWSPQEKVLGHPAIGGFLTHSGWNSTLESIVEGVPMICWPSFVDQQVNSRYVGEVWKLGLDMKDRCDRSVVEKMVKEVMDLGREDFLKRAETMAEMAKASVREGGSSYNDMNNLIEDIRLMSLKNLGGKK